MQSRELVKLYYRIGEVSDIVGVQPHVLRYWETEFRSIRPQKSSKGQRVYSRRDVEKLLRVKDLLKNQGFTIAGARKRLSEAEGEPQRAREPENQRAREPEPQRAREPENQRAREPENQRAREPENQRAREPEYPRAREPEYPRAREVDLIEPDPRAKNMRKVLLGLRQDLMRMLEQISEPKAR